MFRNYTDLVLVEVVVAVDVLELVDEDVLQRETGRQYANSSG